TREQPRKAIEVGVRVAMNLTESETRAVDERRMVETIEKRMIAASEQRRDRAEARLIPRGEDERGFFVKEFGEAALELVVQIERAVQKTAARGSGAIAMRCALRCFEHVRMVCEPEIVVRAHHDPPFAADERFRGRRLLDRREVR